MAVRLHALENFLAVVQHRSSRIHGDWPIRFQTRVAPTAFAGGTDLEVDHHGVVGEVVAEPGVGENRLPVRLRPGARGWVLGEFQLRSCHGSSTVTCPPRAMRTDAVMPGGDPERDSHCQLIELMVPNQLRTLRRQSHRRFPLWRASRPTGRRRRSLPPARSALPAR